MSAGASGGTFGFEWTALLCYTLSMIKNIYAIDDAHQAFLAFLCRCSPDEFTHELKFGEDLHHCVEATFKAVARALRMARSYDPRALDQVPLAKVVSEYNREMIGVIDYGMGNLVAWSTHSNTSAQRRDRLNGAKRIDVVRLFYRVGPLEIISHLEEHGIKRHQ